MANEEKIGEISKEKIDITWKIKDFFSYTEGRSKYLSPEFHALNSVWRMSICPNGKASNTSTRYVSLFLYRLDNGEPKLVDFVFGIKTTNYLVANKVKINPAWKSSYNKGFGFPDFIEISKLRQENETLVPLGNLTIVCTITDKADEDFDIDENKNKLIGDFKQMFVSKKNTDVTIKVQDETFSAHSFILAARSPVLAAMFEHDMTEKKTRFIDICDCDPKAFRHFLLYLYSGELGYEYCDFFLLYKIADKYDVSELKLMCIDLIVRDLSVENFCEAYYIFGHQFNENKLLTKIQNFFNENFERVISLDNWESFLKENSCLANNLLKAMAPKVKIEK